MSNWCYNELVVEGEEEEILYFFDEVAGVTQPIQLGSLLLPDDQDPETRIDLWGTPGEIEESKAQLLPLSAEGEKKKYALVYAFHTPWGPPDVWVENVSGFFPDLRFYLRYGISEIDIASILSAHGGIVNRESEAFYHEVFPDF